MGRLYPKRGFFGKARASLLRTSVLASIRSAQEVGFEGDTGYRGALEEIENGEKKSHWIWSALNIIAACPPAPLPAFLSFLPVRRA